MRDAHGPDRRVVGVQAPTRRSAARARHCRIQPPSGPSWYHRARGLVRAGADHRHRRAAPPPARVRGLPVLEQGPLRHPHRGLLVAAPGPRPLQAGHHGQAAPHRLSHPRVRTEGVPFARVESGFTRDFEDLVAWLATRMDKTAVRRLVRVAWQTVGAICARVVTDQLDPGRLEELFEVGIDEVSWRKGHRYLTLVTDHGTGKVVWGAQGKDTATCDQFFAELGADRAAKLAAVSTDMGAAYLKSVAKPGHAPNATVCIDPFHVVALASDALDQVRRQVWNQLRAVDPDKAKKFKGARWVLLKRPERLTDTQAVTLRKLRRHGGAAWRAYGLKESLREVFAGDLSATEAAELLDRWCAKASRSRLQPLVKLAGTIRTHRDGILAAVRLGSTTPESRRSTTRCGSSPAVPTGSIQPGLRSRW